jgi:hypothetical protein
VRNRFLQAVGVPDGSKTDFETQTAYRAGTLRVLINGLVVDPDLDDGFVEGVPPAFSMKIPPFAGDTIWTFYREV